MKTKITLTKKDCLVIFICSVFLLMCMGAIGGGSRKHAKDIVCRSHLRQWYLVMIEFTNEDHIKAAILLKQIKGYAIVSGYACNLYTELYENYDWQRKDRESNTNSGGKRIESIWLCPRTSEALKPKSKTMRYIED